MKYIKRKEFNPLSDSDDEDEDEKIKEVKAYNLKSTWVNDAYIEEDYDFHQNVRQKLSQTENILTELKNHIVQSLLNLDDK